jgi:tetratricopeptide (TPR) repeat protein
MGESALWNEFGIVYRKMGAYDDAIRSFERAIELAPHFGLAYSNLAMVYSHKGNQVRAISLHQKSIELLKNDNEKAIVWRRVGDIYHLAGDYSHAHGGLSSGR